jgi:xanthine dehydrogenase YagR molybdenum-binding subunit
MTENKTDVILGKPLTRLDGPKKVTGQAKYAAEWLPPGVKHAWLIQSTIAKGTIEGIDDADAKKVPGVVAIITHKNAPQLNQKGSAHLEHELLIMQDNKIYHDRQNIGVVVADTIEAARYAASIVRVHYKAETPDSKLSGKTASTLFAPPDSGMRNISTDSHRGDFDAAYAAAPIKLEATYRIAREIHVPMEPHATTAEWSGDTLTIHDATQGISGVQSRLASIFDIPAKNIRCICKFTGGGFGCKGSVWSHVAITALAAKMTGSPVCLAMERRQSFGPVGFRPHNFQTVKLGADKSGKLLAMSNDTIVENCRYDQYVEYAALPTRFLYSCPNVRTTHRLKPLDIGKPTFQRAPGFSTGTASLEVAMDELAYATNTDPLQLRLINYAERDEHEDLPFSNKNLRKCYEIGAQRFGWDKRQAQPRSLKDGPWLIGYGLATATYPGHFSPAQAKAVLKSDGTAQVTSGSQDLGTGTYTAMAQVAADALGLPMESVHFDLGDTDFPAASGSGGSTTAGSVGTAVKYACDAVIDQLVALATADQKSPLQGLSKENITAANSCLIATDGSQKTDRFTEIMQRADRSQLTAMGTSDAGKLHRKYSMYSFGAHFAEVRVHEELGQIRVTRWVGVFDAGKIYNTRTALSQMYGGITMGIGMALLENMIMDPRYARTMNADLAEYHVPVNADVPPMDIVFVEEPDYKANVLGGYGVGELPITGAAAAVSNAIYNATGVRVREMPITLDTLLT